MPRSIAVIIGIIGLVGAAYLTFHRSQPALGVGESQLDGPLFGIAIGLVSILLLASTWRRNPNPAASQSLASMPPAGDADESLAPGTGAGGPETALPPGRPGTRIRTPAPMPGASALTLSAYQLP